MDEEKKYLLAVIQLYAKSNLYLTSESVMDRTDSKPFHFTYIGVSCFINQKKTRCETTNRDNSVSPIDAKNSFGLFAQFCLYLLSLKF